MKSPVMASCFTIRATCFSVEQRLCLASGICRPPQASKTSRTRNYQVSREFKVSDQIRLHLFQPMESMTDLQGHW